MANTQGGSGSEPLPRRRPVPHSNWPSIKLFYMPEGRLSQRPDERCFMYCSQNVNGRLERRPPQCRSICLRKVFAHEVRNILGYNRHRDALPDGAAKYPLPPEGQVREQVPEETITASGQREIRKADADVQYWEEGWYLWYSRNKWKSLQHIDLMGLDLASQKTWLEYHEARRKALDEKQRARAADQQSTPAPVPQAPDEFAANLFRVPPHNLPLYHTVKSYLAPTHRLMEILGTSFEDGTQVKFAKRVWQTAWTAEPYKLVTVVCSKMWDTWNADPPDEKDGVN